MSYLSKLKAAGPQASSDLFAKLEKSNSQQRRNWYTVTRDKTGTGASVVRFLPPVEGEDQPIVQLWSHAFKNDETGLWYIENSLTTLGQRDPLTEYNQYLYRRAEKEDRDDLKKIVSKQKRNHYYISNIACLKDKPSPENEDKAHLYRFGTRIYDKLKGAMEPKFEGIDPLPVFDLWQGANFNIRVAMDSNKIPQYDASAFDPVSALYDGDEDMLEKIMAQATPLQSVIAPDQFKSYEELEERLKNVLGEPFQAYLEEKASKASNKKAAAPAKPAAKAEPEVVEADGEDVPWENEVTPEPKPAKKAPAKKAAPKVEATGKTTVSSDDAKLFEDLGEMIKDL